MKENSPSIRLKEELSGLPTGSVHLNLYETSPPLSFPFPISMLLKTGPVGKKKKERK